MNAPCRITQITPCNSEFVQFSGDVPIPDVKVFERTSSGHWFYVQWGENFEAADGLTRYLEELYQEYKCQRIANG